ncbi:MAG: Coenzyme F420 hydrogenase/dehydrogenase, beta subunit C-terminal domain [Muribaculaceae bacterium]|nr:Coenzyme F420 hydrogenase/dehydrogenase, beta subunit C-terminal domain [Muribaculaceae bacterium]
MAISIICPADICTGCLACMNVCPTKAIVKTSDELGFLRPQIIADKCIECNLCVKTCPSNNIPDRNACDTAIAAIAKSEDILSKSASGGIATLISENIIEHNGVVYGCDGTDIYNIKHVRISDKESLWRIKGSKYIQSNISDIYAPVLSDLKNGKTVLFFGISCQVAGLLKFLKKPYDNLFCINLVCHGAASQRMISSAINEYKHRLKTDQIRDIRFRKKNIENNTCTGIEYGLFFHSCGRDYSFTDHHDAFTFGYANALLFRDSCYNCLYTKTERVGDMTIGDFWNLQENVGAHGKKSVSLLLLHTAKGQFLFDSIKPSIDYIQRPLAEAIKGNPQLIQPTDRAPELHIFREAFKKNELSFAVRHAKRKVLRNIRIYDFLKTLGLSKIVDRLR